MVEEEEKKNKKKERNRARKLYVAVGLGSVVIAVGVFSFLYIYPLEWQRDFADVNGIPKSNLRIAIITDANFSDNGWGESSLNAARYIEQKYNFSITPEDNVAIPDIEMTLRKYAESGYDLIIAHGFQWGEPALQVGQTYPQTKIVVFTGLVESKNDVASIFPQQQEGSFLLGALAGMLTNSSVIGFVGGEEYPNVVNIFEGYKQGAEWVNDNITVIGTYLNDWDNPARGREAATSIIRQGADFMFHVADSSGQGVIQASDESGIYALGAVQDQNHLAPDTVLSSFVLDVDKAYDSAVKMVMDGNFTGKVFRPGIELQRESDGQGIVYLAPFHGLESRVPESVQERLTKLANEILQEKLEVPERLEAEPLNT
ncbi:MAG TPA: BMP family protein [Nitrososphaera sp.]|jgi:basic membrane protein A|nr:BMP family protein [Nitrososphaera sp.]